MKTLKTILHEGLLKGMDSHLSVTDDDVKSMFEFGGKYTQIKIAHFVKNGKELKDPNWLNRNTLKDLTKNLKATAALQKLYDTNNISETLYMFYKWFESLDLSKFSVNKKYPDLQLDSVRMAVSREITKYAHKLKIFKLNDIEIILRNDWLDDNKLDVQVEVRGSIKPEYWFTLQYYKTR